MNYYIDESISEIGKNIDFNITEKELDQLARKHLKKSKYFKSGMLQNEDLLSNIKTLLWQIESKFDNTKGLSIDAYRINYVNWYILRFIKVSNRTKNQSVTGLDSELFDSLENTGESNQIESRDIVEFLVKSIKLTKSQKKVFYYKYKEMMTTSEISEKLRVSKQNVNQINNKILKKLRTELGVEQKPREENRAIS